MKRLDICDIGAALSILVIGAGVWFIYYPAALILVGTIGFAFSWLTADGRKRA